MLGIFLLKSIINIFLAAIFFGGAVSACVNLKVSAQKSFTTKPQQLRRIRRQKITSWRITGAFSIQQPAQNPVLANYSWQQRGRGKFNIVISAPLRAVVVNIKSNGREVALSQNGKKTIYASSAAQLLRKQLGWSFPVSNLYSWLRALPDPGTVPALQKYDSYGHLIFLRQQGWDVKFNKYQTVNKIDLPRIISLVYKNIRVRLVVKKWVF